VANSELPALTPDPRPLAAGAWPLTPALRVVLFGMPGAGKSSLLGALAQAAQTQEHVLNGHLTDLSQGLGELQRRLYEEAPRQTLEEVVPYPVAFDSFTSSGPDSDGRHLDAIFVDCDGRVANELLARRRSLGADSGDGPLAQQILQSDALILVIDASAPQAQIDLDFAEFGRFLRFLEQNRGRRSDIAGLPVYLALTKCDLLAQPGDNASAWADRIEERKREVGQRFQAFVARRSANGLAPFGTVNLHLRATAVKRPGLVDSPPRAREPYGVAELFRQSLRSARGFRRRQRRSGRRLLWTVAGTLGVVALMAGFATSRLADRYHAVPTLLLEKIANYRASEGDTPSSRLREPFQRKISELSGFKSDPDFSALPEEEQEYIQARLRELEEYRAYWEKLRRIQIDDLRTDAELQALLRRLRTGDLDIPSARQSEWWQTDAGLLHSRLVKNADALREGIRESEEWFRALIRQGEELWTFAHGKPTDASSWAQWQTQVGALLARAFPHAEADELPRGDALTYAAVLRFDRVTSARRDWEQLERRLKNLRDLTAALGLAGNLPRGERQPLDIPEHFSVSQSSNQLERLARLYPELVKRLSKVELPDAVFADLRRAARVSYDHLIEAGRQVILDRLQQGSASGPETPTLWGGVREWLAGPSELRDWRVLAMLLERMDVPDAPDPVTALASFLGQDRFDVNIERVTLEVPFDRNVVPARPLTVYHAAAGAEPVPALTFRLTDDEGHRDPQARVTRYSFGRDKGAALVYRPGDVLYAVLPVKKDGQGDWVLTWARSRSQVYQFERLVRPPRLHRQDQENTQGELLDDVHLAIQPAQGVPAVPDLMPVVILKKR
jgi:GTPase SAR1 family protein